MAMIGAFLGACAMVVATILAVIFRRDLRRLLLYSALSQAVLLALFSLFAPHSDPRLFSVEFVVFAIAPGAAALGLTAVWQALAENAAPQASGLVRIEPLLAIGTVVMWLSIAGVPPFGGFFAKYAAMEATARSGHAWLAGLMLANALLLLFCFLPFISRMFAAPSPPELTIRRYPRNLALSCAVFSLVAGVAGWAGAASTGGLLR